MKRVLFVDDEPQLLAGLRGHMRHMRATWAMEFVGSGPEAIAAFEQQPFDVIVTDQRMPEMDGATLLQVITRRWPRTVRVVLSGLSDQEQTVRLVSVAHQCINKPCDALQLESAISRCLSLDELLRRPALRELVGRMGPLPAAPVAYARLQHIVASETASIAEIAGIVAQDAAIAAKLLQIANSGFFRLPRRITSVEQAIGYLGLDTVRSLAISAEVFSKWSEAKTNRVIHLQKLQQHATRAAGLALTLLPAPLANDAVLAALLHDIGYWVMAQGCTRELAEAARLSIREGLTMDQAERCVLGATHAEIGAYLLGIWGFPNSIVEAVARHHSPGTVLQSHFDTLAALSVTHAFAEPREGEAFAQPGIRHSEITPEYLETVSASFTWDEALSRVSCISH